VGNSYVKLADLGTFSKLHGSTPIEVVYQGRIAVVGTIGGTGVHFELRIDNVASTVGRARANIKKAEAGSDGIPVSITGYFTGLSQGNHTVSMWVSDTYGTSTDVMLDPGCWSTDVAIVKEFK
jgi:hypothetical protein